MPSVSVFVFVFGGQQLRTFKYQAGRRNMYTVSIAEDSIAVATSFREDSYFHPAVHYRG